MRARPVGCTISIATTYSSSARTKGTATWLRPSCVELYGNYLLPWNSVPFSSSDACAAANRAVNRRKGEHDT